MKVKYCAITIFLLLPSYLYAGSFDDFNWFAMIYERESVPGCRSVVYRPFFMENKKKQIFQASLMPLVFWRYKSEKKDDIKSLFGLIESVDYTHESGVKDNDFGFFPLLYYGSSVEKKDRYLLVWPAGGAIKGKLGYEKISAWVFPGFLLFVFFPPTTLASFFSLRTLLFAAAALVPVYATFQYKDYKSTSILWPLIDFGGSPHRKDFRILPFYASHSKAGWYDRYSVLMIFNYEKKYFKADENRTFFILPLYGRKWSRSGKISSTTLLWPFFSWGYDRRSGDRILNMPWPLVQLEDCEKPRIKKRIFFPLFGKYITDHQQTYFATPLFFLLKENMKDFRSEYSVNFFIIWYFKREYLNTADPYYGKTWRFLKLWPVFQYEYNDLGDLSVNVLSLLPFRDPEGYEKLYQPFWTVFEYRTLRDGEKRLGLLLRIYFQRWSGRFLQIKFFPLFNYSEYENKITEFTFLLSGFGYENRSGGRYMRLFWVPVRLGDGDAVKTGKEPSDELHAGEYALNIPAGRLFRDEREPGFATLTFNF